MKNLLSAGLAFLCLTLIAGCSAQLIAPYDSRTLEQMESIDQNIDHLYLTLRALPRQDRTYNPFAERYLDIDVKIRSLKRRQEIREKNQETLTQTKTLASFWTQDMGIHKEKNSISDFMIKFRMGQYRQLMDALIKGELAKKQ